jgi:hypothetical protein
MLLFSTAALAQEPKSVKTERITVPPYTPENSEHVGVVPPLRYVKPRDPMIVRLVYRTEIKDGKAIPVFYEGDVVKMRINSGK